MTEIDPLKELNNKIGYEFSHPVWLAQAFRHASYVNELGDTELGDNERLEFLGDAVLDLATSHILMELFQEAKEGDLSKLRASIVNERGLSHVAKGLGLGEYILLGKGEELSGGRNKPSILANTLEALLGALYLDAGFIKTREIISRLFLPLLVKMESGAIIDDFKSLLQEFTQGAYKNRPEYILLGETGPPHDKIFKVAIHLYGKIIGEGEGRSKKEAEQMAAKEAFICLTREPEGL